MDGKTNLHEYEQKNRVRTQTHKRRRPTFKQESGSLISERLLEDLKHPFPPRLWETLSNSSGKQRQFECLRGPLPATLSHQQGRRRLEESISDDDSQTKAKGHELVATVPAAQLATVCRTRLSLNWYPIHGTGASSNECLK